MHNLGLRLRVFAVLFSALCFLGVLPAHAISNTIVISQIYGAGGNSGATLNQDYIELFNLGTTPVSLSGWSLQYRSSAGASAIDPAKEVAALPNVTMQPGQFLTFAVSVAGANGTAVAYDYDLATPAGSVPLNLSGSAGQVILSRSTTGFAAGCTLSDPNLVDLVGYGTGTTCYEGTGPQTPALTATTAAFRKAVCTDTDNNSADFNTGAPAPRNAKTAVQSCGGTVMTLSVSASANPTTVAMGGTTLLTARVTPLAASTNLAVTVDLSAVGGSATQPLYDDGTHGDTTAGDNVFNLTATIGGNTAGSVTLNFKATDGQAHSATSSTTLTVVQGSALTPIHTVQTGSPSSAYLGKSVTISGIITAITGSGFYVEARDVDQDTDPTTSEAIFVVSGTSTSRLVGDEVQVTGTVQTGGSFQAYATELGGTIAIKTVSTGNTLPTAVTIKASDDTTTGGLQQFLRFQSMRFLIPNFMTTAPTGGTLTENTETVISNGEFYGVVQGVQRPYIEPGISVLETSLPSGATYCTATVTTNCVARFDSNPENFLVESTTLGGAPIDVTANQPITNLLGIVDFTTFSGARLLLDAKAPGTLGTAMTYIAVPVAKANEFTVSSMNIERFYSTTPSSGAVTLTAEAYARRLKKVSLLLRNVQRMPDVIGMQEVGTLATLNDISTQISSDAIAAGQPDPKYSACLINGNDSTGINTAFLVKTTRVSVVDCSQFGKTTTFTNSTGAQATLNDRPPLVLHAMVNVTGFPAYPVTVISNHLKSLIGIDDTTSTGATVRLKKENQDEFLVNLIQGYQAKGEHVVSVGDYNSFFVNDGYVDNIGVITGNPPAAGTVVVGPTSAYVPPSPKLTDLESTVTDPLQRYDYSFIGNAQTLDHIVVTGDLLSGAHIAYSHEDADFPLIQYNDATTPQSSSDHDGAVAFFILPGGVAPVATLTPATQDFGSVATATSSAAKTFTLTNTGTVPYPVSGVAVSGDFAQTNNCPAALIAAASCTVSVTFTPTATGARSGTLSVTSTGSTTLTATLTGTGTAPSATLTLTPASLAFGTSAVGASSAAQVLTLTNSGTGAATLGTPAVTGDFAQTTTCGSTLAAGANCTLSVTFAPTAAGARSGSMTIVSGGTSLASTLSGTGGAQISLTPGSAAFPPTAVGSTSTAQVFTVTNTSGAALTFGTGAINLTPATTVFAQTNTCGTGLAAGATCTVNVTFAPTATGSFSSTLTVTSTLRTFSTSVTSALTATAIAAPAADFTLTPATQSGMISSGSSATFSLSAVSVNGYTGTVTFSCAPLSGGQSCTATTPTLPVTASTAANATFSIATNQRVAGLATPRGAGGMLASMAALMGVTFLFRKRRPYRIAGLLCALLMLAAAVSGCSGSGFGNNFTPGNYTYVVTATDGTRTHTANYVLTVTK